MVSSKVAVIKCQLKKVIHVMPGQPSNNCGNFGTNYAILIFFLNLEHHKPIYHKLFYDEKPYVIP